MPTTGVIGKTLASRPVPTSIIIDKRPAKKGRDRPALARSGRCEREKFAVGGDLRLIFRFRADRSGLVEHLLVRLANPAGHRFMAELVGEPLPAGLAEPLAGRRVAGQLADSPGQVVDITG